MPPFVGMPRCAAMALRRVSGLRARAIMSVATWKTIGWTMNEALWREYPVLWDPGRVGNQWYATPCWRCMLCDARSVQTKEKVRHRPSCPTVVAPAS